MSQAIAALVYAAQESQETAAPTMPILPPVSNDYVYPPSSLQHIGFFILFFFPTLALIVVALRVYSRVSTKQFGWGKRSAEAREGVAMMISMICSS